MRAPRRGARLSRAAVLLCAVLAPALARSSCETKPGDYHLIALPPDRTTPNEWMPPGAGACGHFTARVSPGGQVSLFARYALPQPWASWCNRLEYWGESGLFSLASGGDEAATGGGGLVQEERVGRRRRRQRRRRRRQLMAAAEAAAGGGGSNATTAAALKRAALVDAAQEGGGPFTTSVPLTLFDAGVELPPSALITLVGLPPGAGASGTGDGADATAAAAAAAGARAPRPVLADGPAIVRLRVCTEGGCDSVDFALVTPGACLLGARAQASPCARAGAATGAGSLVVTPPPPGGRSGGGGGAGAGGAYRGLVAAGAPLATCLPCYLGSQRLEGLALLAGPPSSEGAVEAAGELTGLFSACAACPPGTAAPPPPGGDDAAAAASAEAASPPAAAPRPSASAALATPAPGTCLPCPGGTVSGVYGAKLCLSECAPGTYAPEGASSCQPCPPGAFQRGAAAASCSVCPADSWSAGVFFESGQGCLRCSNGRKCATVPVRDPPAEQSDGGGSNGGNSGSSNSGASGNNGTSTAADDALAAAVASVSADPDAEAAAARRQNTDAAPLCAPRGDPRHFASSRHAPRFVLVDARPPNGACLRVAAAAAQLARVTVVLDRTCEAPVWYGASPPPPSLADEARGASGAASRAPDAEPALLAGFVSRGGALRPPGARAPYAARTVSAPPVRYGHGPGGPASALMFAEAHQVVLERGDHGGLFSRQLAGDGAAAALGRMWRATQPSRLSFYSAGYEPVDVDVERGTVVFGPPADLGLVGEPSCAYTLRLADDVFYEMAPAPCPPGERGCAPAAAVSGNNNSVVAVASCGAGRYRVPMPQDTAACAYCPPGTASADGAGRECEPCAPGTFAQGVGNARCDPCARGFVATLPGAAACLPCGFELSLPAAAPEAGSQAAKGVAFYADPKAAKAGADAAAGRASSGVATGASGRYTYWVGAARACEPCPAGAVSGLPTPTGSAKCFSIDPRTRAPCCATCPPGSSADACPAGVAEGGESVAAAAAKNKTALASDAAPDAVLPVLPASADPFVSTQVAGAVLAVVGEPLDVVLPPTDGQARPSNASSSSSSSSSPGDGDEAPGGGGCSGEPFGEALRCMRQFGAYFGYRLGPPLECRYQRLPLPDMVLALELGPAAGALSKAAAMAARATDARPAGNNATASSSNSSSGKDAPSTSGTVNPFSAAAEQGAMLEVRRCRALLGSTLFPGQGFLLDSSAAWLDAPAPEVSPWPQAFRMRPGAPGVDPLDLSPRGHRALVQPAAPPPPPPPPGGGKGPPPPPAELELTLWDYSRYGAGRQSAYDAPPYTPPLPSDAATPLRGCRVRLAVTAGSALGVSAPPPPGAAAAAAKACPPGTEPSGPACLLCASDTASDGRGPCVSCEPPRVAPFPGMGACVPAERAPAAVQADLLSPTPPGSTALGGNPATCEGEFGFGARRR